MSSPPASSSSSSRHGLRLTCQQCGYRIVAGGYSTDVERDQIETAFKNLHTAANPTHTFTVAKDFHAAELQHVSVAQPNIQTTPAPTNVYSDIPGAIIANTSLTAGKKYLISITAVIDGSVNSTAAQIRTVHGGAVSPTPWTDSEHKQVPVTANTGRMNYAWWTVWTAVAGEDVKLQFSNSTLGNTTRADHIHMIAIKLSDDLTENTDWKLDDKPANTALTTTPSTTNNASTGSLQFATTNKDLLIFTKSRITVAATNRSYASRIDRTGESPSTGPFTQFEGKNATLETFVQSQARAYLLTANTASTFEQRSYSVAGNSGTRTHSAIFYLDLSKLRNVIYSYLDTPVLDLAAGAYATNVRTVNLTPAVTGNVWTYGLMTVDVNAASLNHKARIQINDSATTEFPVNVTADNYTLTPSTDITDEPQANIQGVINLSAATTYKFDLDGSVNTTQAGRGARARFLMAATMELVQTGLNHIKHIDDTVGTSEAQPSPSYIRERKPAPLADTIGLTEQIPPTISNRLRLIDETVGLSDQQDSKTIGLNRQLDETVGLSDQAFSIRNLKVVINDGTVGISEADPASAYPRPAIAGFVGTGFEDTGFTTDTPPVIPRAGFIDSGFTDTGFTVQPTPNELEARIFIADSISHVLNRIHTINEIVGIVEQLLAPPTGVPFGGFMGGGFLQTDFVTSPYDNGFTGTGFTTSGFVTEPIIPLIVKRVNEELGIIESTPPRTRLDRIRLFNDTVGITENIVAAAAKIRTVNDTIGLAESHNIAINLIRVINEQLEINESLIKRGDIVRHLEEQVGILEDAKRNLALNRVVNETIELAETIQAGLQRTRILNDGTVGLTDLVESLILPVAQEYKKVIDETVGISETLNTIFGRVVTINENVSLSEADPVIRRDLARIVNEDIGLVETLNKLANIVRAVNEDVHVAETLEKVSEITRLLEEQLGIEDSAIHVRALTQTLSDVIGLSDTQISAPGKVKVIEEVLSILEDIVTTIEHDVAPPPPPPQPVLSYNMSSAPQKARKIKFPRIRKPPHYFIHPPKEQDIEEPEKEPQPEEEKEETLIVVVESSLTLRWNQEGAISKAVVRNWLEAKALIAGLEQTHWVKAKATTIRPILRETANTSDDVIVLKEAVESSLTLRSATKQTVESSLTIRYNIQEEIEPLTLAINWLTRQTVESSLTIRYNIEDRRVYEELQELHEIMEMISLVSASSMTLASISDVTSRYHHPYSAT